MLELEEITMLTIINAKTGEVKQENIPNLAPGQVLVKNCSDEFIQALLASIKGVGQPTQEVFKDEVADAKQRIAKFLNEIGIVEPKKGCCATHTSDLFGEVAVPEPEVRMSKVAPKRDLPTLRKELAKVLTDDELFLTELMDAVEKSKTVNPTASQPTDNHLRAGLALYAHYDTNDTFSAGEAVTAFAPVCSAGRSIVRVLATDFNILEVAGGRLAATKYRVTKAFANAVCRRVQNVPVVADAADQIQDEIDNLLES